jgi:anti-sigma regulatory factor (Ser/Thr protein kinase)
MLAAVTDPSQIAQARRAAGDFARAAGFGENDLGRIAIVATEMATNLLKHADGGEIVIGSYDDCDGAGMELIALDKGRGIADIARALEDGFSTAGSPGSGLGAIRRQADGFAVWSRAGRGAAVMARFGRAPGTAPVTLGAVVEPFPGEAKNGDGWFFRAGKRGPTLLMIDGAGHGAPAAAVVTAAGKVFDQHHDDDLARLTTTLHRALAPTRGGAAALSRIDVPERLLRFIGIGNIAAAIIHDGITRRMVSHNGVAGHVAPHIREFTYPWHPGDTIIMHSDGLSAKWDMADYPGLALSHPSLIAAILFRDHRRPKDDASVVAMTRPP